MNTGAGPFPSAPNRCEPIPSTPGEVIEGDLHRLLRNGCAQSVQVSLGGHVDPEPTRSTI
jgi:hypothetical protein